MIIPPLTIRLDGARLDARVLALRVAGQLSQPAQAEVTLDADASWAFGARLQIEVGDDELFDGEVTAVELVRGPGSERALLLRGYDKLHQLRKRQLPRVFTHVTIADLARELTADLGITVQCPDPGSSIERLVQHRQSDWELLSQTAARCGRYLVLDGDTLVIDGLRPRGAAVELKVGDSLWQCRVEANVDRAVREVSSIGWHPRLGEVTTGRAADRGFKPGGKLDPGAGGTRTLLDQSVDLQTEAAQAALDRSAARVVCLSGTARGDVALRPGRTVAVTGLDDAIDGAYPICSAVHTVTAEGYRTVFGTEPPAPAALPTGASVTLGKVTSVNDPDAKGRVQVSLLAYGDLDIGWLGVLCPGAGPGKGIVALPDPGDLVVIALPHENPAEGIVLGAIYGPETPKDTGVSGGSVQRWTLHSGGGQSIVIDDSEKSIKMANADGSSLELAPGTVRLLAHTDLVIEAPGHSMTIRAASVDFERALLPVPSLDVSAVLP
ncbi:phage protein D/phage baseplate assembly protein gpV [Allocatelliglobosispora scoriae]|uniref:Phage protein D/phage baseplate assembly protein gpV n=1 Tax=Allocatelliglobosispora scoriae TaxID=643052 RepID=A0A841BZE2_9ACTN|nr:phage baseplate assembly protein V [Allocatelliglobosispora scoriae]MBB5872956.1 phage protein D/phage baseplate assembly protein gpV [Allocatelliglobosispora scoriae]